MGNHQNVSIVLTVRLYNGGQLPNPPMGMNLLICKAVFDSWGKYRLFRWWECNAFGPAIEIKQNI